MVEAEFPYNNVEAYLEATGVLETGDSKTIEQARKTFRKLYLRQYQKRYGKKHSSVNIAFTNTDKQLLGQVAAKNGKKLASFIKELAIQVTGSEHKLFEASTDLSEIKRLFSLCYDIVETLQFENEYPELKNSFDELEKLFSKIETLLNGH